MTAAPVKASAVLAAGRACYGLVLLAFPAPVIRGSGAAPSRESCQVVRLLGIRHVTQAAASVLAGRRVLVAGAVIDGLHAASMLLLTAAVPRLRRAELADGAVAGLMAGVGLTVRFGPSGGR